MQPIPGVSATNMLDVIPVDGTEQINDWASICDTLWDTLVLTYEL